MLESLEKEFRPGGTAKGANDQPGPVDPNNPRMFNGHRWFQIEGQNRRSTEVRFTTDRVVVTGSTEGEFCARICSADGKAASVGFRSLSPQTTQWQSQWPLVISFRRVVESDGKLRCNCPCRIKHLRVVAPAG